MSKNISKERREKLLVNIEELRNHLKNTNASSEMTAYLTEIEAELKRQKFGLIFEEHKEEIDNRLETDTPVLTEETDLFIDNGGQLNFIIEGDNLASLALLEKTHKEKIDVIYIDPPYNTGAEDWKYDNNFVDKNDLFRHSKWLSMMSKRIEIAKRLLAPNGVLICAIDENEQATLSLLIEQIFGQAYSKDCITIVHNPRGVQGKNFSYIHEYAIFIYKTGQSIIGKRKIDPEKIKWSPLRNWGGESLRTDAKNCFYPIIVEKGIIVGFGDVVFDLNIHPQRNEKHGDSIWVYPIDKEGVERKWRYARQSVEDIKDNLRAKKKAKGYEIELGKETESNKTVWTDEKYDANQYGTQMVNDLVAGNTFNFPKSLWNTYDCLYAIVGDKSNAVILDFFAGSGTTGHAVMEMNKDGGKRRFILCTNNENNICKDVTYQRIKTVITGKRKDGSEYGKSIEASLKYQKIEFVPTAEKTYYDYAEELLRHVKELVELENAVNFEGNSDLEILLTESEVEKTFDQKDRLIQIKTIYLGHDVSLNLAQQIFLQSNRIAVNIIPEYYYKEKQI